MKHFYQYAIPTIIACITLQAAAQVPLSGYFIAREECDALLSIRRQTNPGDIFTELDHAYDLIGKNRPAASHYLISIEAEPNRRWVPTRCGEHVQAVDSINQPPPPTTGAGYILAISWQPGFCETRPAKPECVSQTAERFDASHFTLHGLWPQPRGNAFCNVAPEQVALDKNKRWNALPELALETQTRDELNKVMPGTQSFLQRHEWIKHGSCYNGESADKYYQDSLKLMRELNHDSSTIRTLFANNIGSEITATEIAQAFDATFGAGARKKIKISCKRDGNRKLITEITIGLDGVLDEISMSDAILAAAPANNIGCNGGVVDPVGLQ